MTEKPKFELGQVVATPACLEVLEEAKQSHQEFLTRHLRLEQGELGAEDHQANEMSLLDGGIILSAFFPKTGVKNWVLTEAVGDGGKRVSTCLMLPSDF